MTGTPISPGDRGHGLECFPEPRFVPQAEELPSAVDPIAAQLMPHEVGMPGTRPQWMAVFGRLQVLRGDVEPVPGVRLVALPGHTPGPRGALVETAAWPASHRQRPRVALGEQPKSGVQGGDLEPGSVVVEVRPVLPE